MGALEAIFFRIDFGAPDEISGRNDLVDQPDYDRPPAL